MVADRKPEELTGSWKSLPEGLAFGVESGFRRSCGGDKNLTQSAATIGLRRGFADLFFCR